MDRMFIKGCLTMRMRMMAVVVVAVLASVTTASASSSPSSGCSFCPAKHLQQHYCDADVVIRGRVRDDRTIKVAALYRGEESMPITRGRPTLSYEAPECVRAQLQPGSLYLIMGRYHDNILHIGACDSVQPWSTLTSIQMEGVKEAYKLFCSQCSINSSYSAIRPQVELDWLAEDNDLQYADRLWRTEDCFYNPLAARKFMVEDCETRHSVCVPHEGGRCSWLRTEKFEVCSKTRQASPCLKGFAPFALASWRCPEDCYNMQAGCMRDMCLRDTVGIDCFNYNNIMIGPELSLEK